MAKKVLIVDNEIALVENLRHNLELDGYTVSVESESQFGMIEARTFLPDLVIAALDALQDRDGRFLSQLRKEFDSIPVLVLGTRYEDAHRVRGFRLGLDDFVLRSTPLSELHRRIDILAHKSAMENVTAIRQSETTITFGSIAIKPATRAVENAGREVPLRLKEFDLLMALIGREGRVASRLDLLREVWGFRTMVVTRTVDTHIAELRRKLEKNPANPKHILTVRKIGYRLVR